MTRLKSRAQRQAEFLEAAARMYSQLEDWYDTHPDASFGELEAEARRQRRAVMGQALAVLINGRDTGYQLDPPTCPQCGQAMPFERYRTWQVHGLEGDTELSRAYYVCRACDGQTLFPPGSETAAAGRSLERRRGAGGDAPGLAGPVV
ncbi:MAG: hypothetical protein HY320_03545 [Armatimonadetes bacterium]|nr:hypothetical protein [Armatimonadota bacterium]